MGVGNLRRATSICVSTAALLAAGCYGGLNRGIEQDTDPAADGGDDADDDGGSGDDGGDDVPGGLECEGEIVDPGPNLVRRLTVNEYVNTVRAVVGVDVEVEAIALLPAELRADGFTNTASGLISTLDHIESYDALAEIAVARIPDLGAFVATWASCTDFTDACERDYVEALGLRAFRRPLTADEVDLLVPVFDAAAAEGESFEVGAGLVLEAMLQSPPFIYRLEDETSGTVARALDGFEIASRLSYLLWSGPPDDELLDAAAADTLTTDDQITAQVERMLADPQARAASVGFVADWLHLSRLDHLPRDPERFPDWSTDIGRAMQDETTAFFASIAWEQDRALVDLFSAQEAWLTPDLAAYYGLPPAGEGLQAYDVSGVPERGGILTQGSLLTIGGDESSMVSRGLFVLQTLLCGDLASPPPGIDTTPPEVEPGKSQRDYSEERTNNASCAGCHIQMEPLAWGLERFVADGTYRTEDWLGNPLREDGYLLLPGEGEEKPYTTVGEMMDLLAGSDRVRECLALKGTQFAVARPLLESDTCSIDGLQASFAASDGTWRDLVLGITLSPGFRSIRVEEAP